MWTVFKKGVPHFGVFAGYLILALVFLWPLPLEGVNQIIGGGGDPELELWTLCWNAHWFAGGTPSYFDANICHPEQNSLAFADHLFSQALIFTPLQEITGNPVLSYNLLLALTIALSGYGAWLCARGLGLSPAVSLVVGMLFAFFPFRTAQVKHLHILSTQWLPFSFFFLIRFLQANRFRWWPLGLFTLFSLLHVLCSFYQALIWALLIGITVVAFLIGGSLGWRKSAGLLSAALVIALALAPFVTVYFQVSDTYGIVRSINENIHYSARPGQFLHPSPTSLLHRAFVQRSDDGPPSGQSGEHHLYPGIIFTVLLTWGMITTFRSARTHRRIWFLLLAATLTALVLSFGPVLVDGDGDRLLPLPYALLYHWLPGVKGLRVPARLVLLLHFSGALLAGLGLQSMLGSRMKQVKGWTAAVLLSALIFLEGVSFDLPSKDLPLPGSMPAAYQAIRELPPDTVLLELPTHMKHLQYLPMYTSTFHFRPLANGRSGIIPPVTARLGRLTDPASPHALGPALLDHMLETGINTILLHRQWNRPAINRLTIGHLRGLGVFTRQPLPDRDIIYRLDAERGREEDVTALPDGPLTRGTGPALSLAPEDAFPTTLNRPVRMTVEGDRLLFGERVHFRWLTRIPAGRWQLTMQVGGLTHTDNRGLPCSIQADLAGITVIHRDDLQARTVLRGSAVEVQRTAHYRISLLVRGQNPHRPIRLQLRNVRLVPVARED